MAMDSIDLAGAGPCLSCPDMPFLRNYRRRLGFSHVFNPYVSAAVETNHVFHSLFCSSSGSHPASVCGCEYEEYDGGTVCCNTSNSWS